MLSFKQFITEKTGITIDAWHGSGTFFSRFDPKKARLKNDYYGGGVGYFTDNKDVGKSYAHAMSRTSKTPHLYHTTLKMNKVFDVDQHYTGEHLKTLLPKDKETFARHAGLLPYGTDKYHVLGQLESGSISISGDQIFRGLSHGMAKTAQARNHLIKKGYDGLRYNGGLQTKGIHHNVYIPYNHDSIKIHKVEKL